MTVHSFLQLWIRYSNCWNYFINSKQAVRGTIQSPLPRRVSHQSLRRATLPDRSLQNYRGRGAQQRHQHPAEGLDLLPAVSHLCQICGILSTAVFLLLQVCEWKEPEELARLLDLELRAAGEPHHRLLQRVRDVAKYSIKTSKDAGSHTYHLFRALHFCTAFLYLETTYLKNTLRLLLHVSKNMHGRLLVASTFFFFFYLNLL